MKRDAAISSTEELEDAVENLLVRLKNGSSGDTKNELLNKLKIVEDQYHDMVFVVTRYIETNY